MKGYKGFDKNLHCGGSVMLTLRYRYASLINPDICANCGETDAPKKETHWGYVCSECRKKCSECEDWMLGESVTIAGKEFCKDCAAEIDALADRIAAELGRTA